MEGVLAAFAQFDNDVRSDRTRAGMRAALELGRWTFLADRLPERSARRGQEPRLPVGRGPRRSTRTRP
jgi:DNA invertase Pin-like site-specific DNA recombinase